MAEIACTCGARLEAGDESAGGRGRCPVCGKVVAVPSAAPQPLGRGRGEPGELRLACEAGGPDAALEAATTEPGALVCPACKGLLMPDAVLCTRCGLDLRTGEKLPPPLVAGEAAEEAEGEPDSPAHAPGLWFPPRLLLLRCSQEDALSAEPAPASPKGREEGPTLAAEPEGHAPEPPPLPPFCPGCGAMLAEGGVRCDGCGFDLLSGEAPPGGARPAAGLWPWLREPCATGWRIGAFLVALGFLILLGGDLRSRSETAWVPRGWEQWAVLAMIFKYAVQIPLAVFFFWGLWTEREWVGKLLVGFVAVGSVGIVLLAAPRPSVGAPAAFVAAGISLVTLPAVLGWVLVLRPGATRGMTLAGFVLVCAADLAMVLLLGGA